MKDLLEKIYAMISDDCKAPVLQDIESSWVIPERKECDLESEY